MKSYCKDCDNGTNHDVLKEYFHVDSEEDAQWWEHIKYQIIKCNGCDKIQFRLLYRDSNISSYSSEEDDENWEEELYPKYNQTDLKPKEFKYFPSHLKILYFEIIRSYNVGHFILCTIGIRIILEGICKEKKIKGGKVLNKNGGLRNSKMLDGKISGLIEQRLFSESNKDILDSLRIIGNKAAHEVKSPSKEGLRVAISIIEHTIEHLYELKMKSIT